MTTPHPAPPAAVETLPDAFAASQALEIRVIGAEAAGIFWLGAELAILLAVLAARAYLRGPVDAPLFPPSQRRRFAVWLGGLLAVGAVLLARHLVWRAPHRTAAMTEWTVHGDPARVDLAYHAFLTSHHVVWLVFVAGWVILEALIVWHGLFLYCALMRRLRS